VDNFARDIVCSRACVLLDVGVRHIVAAGARDLKLPGKTPTPLLHRVPRVRRRTLIESDNVV